MRTIKISAFQIEESPRRIERSDPKGATVASRTIKVSSISSEEFRIVITPHKIGEGWQDGHHLECILIDIRHKSIHKGKHLI
jgi:hypothetical protein